MTITEIFFSALVIGAVVSDIGRFLISPFLFAIQYLCWIPAFNFWSDQETIGFGEKLWFAQGWVQFLVFFAIVGLNFLIIRLFNALRY